MKVLVVGYYGRDNLGDEMFKEAFLKLLPSHSLTFYNVDEVEKLTSNIGSLYDSIIVGGGDLINEYFQDKIKSIRSSFAGCIYAIGIGIPYKELISKNSLEPYDYVFVRNKSYLREICLAVGSERCHYLPDIVTSLVEGIPRLQPQAQVLASPSSEVGVYLASSFNTPALVYNICRSIERLLEVTDYTFRLICFDTSEKEDGSPTDNSDVKIVTLIANCLTNARVIADTKRYTSSEMVDIISSQRMTICTRFHAHILSIVSGVPFLSFHYANKVTLLTYENDYNYVCGLVINSAGKPLTFNSEEFVSKFLKLNRNWEEVRQKVDYIRKRDRYLLTSPLLDNILKVGKRRLLPAHHLFLDNVEVLYKKYKNVIERSTGCALENSYQKLSEDAASRIAKELSFEITNEISSSYVSGLTGDIRNTPWNLRGMIDWVWKHKRDMFSRLPSFNLEYVSSLSFNGMHRAGWSFVIEGIKGLHSPYGPVMDMFCDATFGWCRDSPCESNGLIPYTMPWVGWFHHTTDTNYSDNNIIVSTASDSFKRSLPTCLGLYVMSSWIATWLRERLSSYGYSVIRVEVIKHPTGLNVKMFDARVLDAPSVDIVNVGAWLRNAFSIYACKFGESNNADSAADVPPLTFTKARLKGRSMENYFPPPNISAATGQQPQGAKVFTIAEQLQGAKLFAREIIDDYVENGARRQTFLYCMYSYLKNKNYLRDDNDNSVAPFSEEHCLRLKHFVEEKIASVKVLSFLENDAYDELLSSSVVFLDVIECSAVNTLIECIARCNPIIVNRQSPIVEYIGVDYPLLYDKLEDLEKLVTRESLKTAHSYLLSGRYRRELSIESFYDSLYNGEIARLAKL